MINSERTPFCKQKTRQRTACEWRMPTVELRMMLHLERRAEVGDEAFAEFDGVAGGEMRPLGASEGREFGKVFEVDAGSVGAL